MSVKLNFQELKNQVIAELNKVRTDPKSYIPILNKYIGWFDGTLLCKPGVDFEIETKELLPIALKSFFVFFISVQRHILDAGWINNGFDGFGDET